MGEQRIIAQPEGYPAIYVWESAGETWACCASDHGATCRLCQRVDETFAALLENCAAGMMVARAKPSGEFEFRTTAKGDARAEALISGDVEMAAFYAGAQRGQARPKLNAIEERVLHVLSEVGGEATPEALAIATGFTPGQVEAALATLAEVGFIA